MTASRLPQSALPALLATAVLGACAHLLPVEQTIDVQVEADSPLWVGPLVCRARNGMGHWQFEAPGTVTVLTSRTPLVITCEAAEGASTQRSTTAPLGSATEKAEREGKKTGAGMGAGAGVVAAVAAAPLVGVPVAVLMVVGLTVKGAEIGGMVGAATSNEVSRYPSVVVLKVHKSDSPASR